MPAWRELYTTAVLETDPARLREMIQQTEIAMLLRLMILGAAPDGEIERQEIENASYGLLTLKTERLGWPSPQPPPRSDAFSDRVGLE